MDKNFIRVDDLMRQRLGGGEERERSGAWLNMRELLDKEMPQHKRIGIFYWRRLFSVVAVLSLVGTLSIGSYQLSSAFNNGTTASTVGQDYSAVNNEPGNVYAVGMDDGGKSDQAKHVVRTSGHIDGISKRRQRHVVAENTEAKQNTETNVPLIAGNDETALNSSATSKSSTKSAGNAIVDRPVTAGVNSTEKADKTSNSTTQSDKNISSNRHSSVAASGNDAANEKTIAKAGKANENKYTSDKYTNAAQTGTAAAKALGKNTNIPAAEKSVGRNSNAHGNSKLAGGNGASAKNNNSVSRDALAKNDKTDAVGAAGVAHAGKDDKMVLNSGAPVVADASNGDKLTKHAGSSTKGADANAGRNDNKNLGKIDEKATAKHTARNSSPAQTAANAGASSNKSSSSNSASGKLLTTGGVAPKNTGSDEEDKSTENKATVENSTPNPDNNTQGKRVITKLVVHERNIKVAENEYALRVDTISMIKVNMDLGIAPATAVTGETAKVAPKKKKGRGRRHEGENNSLASSATSAGSTPGASIPASRGKKGSSQLTASTGKAPAGKPASGTTLAASNGEANMAGTGGEGNQSASESVAASSASAAELNADGSEVKVLPEAAKKHSGVSLIQKLSMAFNEVKENASATKFVAGISAGINSNFFGPSSFKGFQFGLTGEIIFNNSWNIMTEMKYFHRLNNNTSIDDNFYTYTPVNGQYRKQLQLNSYSFSALHSLEMPVAVRYNKGSFNFYAGPNLLYSFSINTGASTMPASTVAPEYVSEEGTDNKGTLSETDFKSRFGLGYLFGFSYQVAPNLNLDLRNVQTVWDNAATTGAKSISGQLYKTPSLQLSIMYRLGGNRSKD